MKFQNISEVKQCIDKNLCFINEIEKLLTIQQDDLQKLELLTFIGRLRSELVTGEYASTVLEEEIVRIGRKIVYNNDFLGDSNEILIVLTRAEYIGGHPVIANNWIEWDAKHTYSIVFTDQRAIDVPVFLVKAVRKSGGKIFLLSGNYIEKAKELMNTAKRFWRIILLSHMEDVVPTLAFGNDRWNVPVYFYNHADYRFSYGFSVSDVVLNLNQFDIEKSINYRGISRQRCIQQVFPNGGVMVNTVQKRYSEEEKEDIRKECAIGRNEKLVVSMGADFKFESIIDYEFNSFAKRLVEECKYNLTFLIIGADKKRDKWKELELNTKGKVRALGFLPRVRANQIIAAADLYICSFPMASHGSTSAEKAGVPWLILNIIGRGLDPKDIRTANSIDELIEKSLDILSGNGESYKINTSNLFCDKDLWIKNWELICEKYPCHKIHSINPSRDIQMQELINCQLIQPSAANYVRCCFEQSQFEKTTGDIIHEKINEYFFMNEENRTIEKRYKKLDENAKRYYDHYLLAIQWTRLKQKKVNIESYLLQLRLNKIAIYGMGYLGWTLFEELKGTAITVCYGIDRNGEGYNTELQVYKNGDRLESVDAIIDTTGIGKEKLCGNNLTLQEACWIDLGKVLNALYLSIL